MSEREIDRRYDIEVLDNTGMIFYEVFDGWAIGVCAAISSNKYLKPYYVDFKTINAHSLTERVFRAQDNKVMSILHYRDKEFNSYPKTAKIFAARAFEYEDGPVVRLWIALSPEETDYIET